MTARIVIVILLLISPLDASRVRVDTPGTITASGPGSVPNWSADASGSFLEFSEDFASAEIRLVTDDPQMLSLDRWPLTLDIMQQGGRMRYSHVDNRVSATLFGADSDLAQLTFETFDSSVTMLAISNFGEDYPTFDSNFTTSSMLALSPGEWTTIRVDVPEPSGLVLLAIGGLCAVRRKRWAE